MVKLTSRQYAQMTGEKAQNKYRNTRVETPDGKFDSERELDRWAQLRIMERAGLISGLRRQVKYPLRVEGVLIGVYIADFVYADTAGDIVVEDAKGVRTAVYLLKKKLVLALYGVAIKEV
jgi:hypothetical protein